MQEPINTFYFKIIYLQRIKPTNECRFVISSYYSILSNGLVANPSKTLTEEHTKILYNSHTMAQTLQNKMLRTLDIG
jgi:hypothetical protein